MDEVSFSDDYFMKEALKEAQKAFDADEVPVGVVVVCGNRIISRAHNLTQRLNDVTAHAEMQAITSTAHFLNGKYLNECTLYVTLEPCLMCAGALSWAQLGKLVYGASDVKRGYNLLTTSNNFNRISDISKGENNQYNVLHPKTEVVSGILKDECATLLKMFFQKKR